MLWLLRGVAVPVLLLPLFGKVASAGWSGLRLTVAHRWLYWLQVALLLAVAVYVPLWIFHFIPRPAAFWLQTVSLIVRIGVAYLLFVGSLLALEFFTSSGKPLRTQLNTSGSP